MSVIYINLDDIRKVLAEHQIDPRRTNAAKVRELLGRGGPNTIQKHLDTLRLELEKAEAPPAPTAQIPPAPTDLVSQVWGAAWTAAQLSAMTRIEKLSIERDAALNQVEVLIQDRDGLLADAEVQIEKLTAAEAATAEAQAQYQAEREALQLMKHKSSTEFDDIHGQLEFAKTQLASAMREAEHAAQLAVARESAMQETIARLAHEIGELKSNLYALAQGKQPGTDSPAP